MAEKSEKKRRIRYTSPKGSALFAHVVDVYYGSEKYPDPKGGYSISLALEEADAQRLLATLSSEIEEANATAEEAFAELKPAAQKRLGSLKMNELGAEEYDTEGVPTGRRLFRFKTGAFYERNGRKLQRKIALFDSVGQPVQLKEEPGNGSIIRTSFTAAPYFVEGTGTGGLTLYLDAVQILRLTRAGERSASEYGFAAEEEGFCGTDLDQDEVSTTASPSSDITNDDELGF